MTDILSVWILQNATKGARIVALETSNRVNEAMSFGPTGSFGESAGNRAHGKGRHRWLRGPGVPPPTCTDTYVGAQVQ